MRKIETYEQQLLLQIYHNELLTNNIYQNMLLKRERKHN